MLKLQKILSILFIILLFFITLSFATDINMNLETDNVEDNYEETTLNEEEFDDDTTISNITEDTSTSNVPSTIVSNSNSSAEDTLSLTNILNILLIVVGVVLILLGIAILIRMHS